MDMERSIIHVSGVVQGVFFRSFTMQKASGIGLTGYVENLPDGRVKAVVEGSKGKIDALLNALKEGPPASRVDNVEIVWESPTGEFNDFSIRR